METHATHAFRFWMILGLALLFASIATGKPQNSEDDYGEEEDSYDDNSPTDDEDDGEEGEEEEEPDRGDIPIISPTTQKNQTVHESEHYDPGRQIKIDNHTEIHTVNQTLPHQHLDVHNRTLIQDLHQTNFEENSHTHNRTIVHSTSEIGPNFRATQNRTIHHYSWNRTEEPDVEQRRREEAFTRLQEEERRRQDFLLQERRRSEEEKRRLVAENERKKLLWEENRRQEEIRRQAEIRRREEETRRLEEIRRQDEENRRLEEIRRQEEENRRLEETRRQDEENRRVEEARRKLATEPPLVLGAGRPRSSLEGIQPPNQFDINENLREACADYKPGEDDLQAFDFIRRFKLDVTQMVWPHVVHVRGSNKMQTAYRLEKDADLKLSTKTIFPNGVPQEFSLTITFRMRKLPKNSWSLFQLSNSQNRPQFQVTVNPKRETIEFAIVNYDNKLESIGFSQPQIFDKNWHKVQFAVTRDKVTLYVDCEEASVEQLEPRGNIDSDGTITIAKLVDNQQTFPIDLQWMVLSCDPTRPQRETCDELPEKKESGTCEAVCPPGPQGLPGIPGPAGVGQKGEPGPPGRTIYGGGLINREPGPKGERGFDGLPGQRGEPGVPGERGFPGTPGLPGPPGPPGSEGVPSGFSGSAGKPGQKGEVGEDGRPGFPGPMGPKGNRGDNGLPGIDGERGPRGPQGMPGPQGPPGRSVSENEVREICAGILREQLAELTATFQGPPGPPGKAKMGRPGPPGLLGPPGEPGRPGIPGERGFPGIPGPPGPQGPEGPAGERGDKGDRGSEGVGIEGPMGLRGPPGPPGQDGIGSPGPQGERGEPGRTGKSGPVGPPGPTGQCDCSSMSNYVQMIAAATAQRPPGSYKGPALMKGP